jgi:hypothetical protein
VKALTIKNLKNARSAFKFLLFDSESNRNALPCFFFLYIFFEKIFFSYYNLHCFICRPSDSTVPTDAGIEARTVATGALAVGRSNH